MAVYCLGGSAAGNKLLPVDHFAKTLDRLVRGGDREDENLRDKHLQAVGRILVACQPYSRVKQRVVDKRLSWKKAAESTCQRFDPGRAGQNAGSLQQSRQDLRTLLFQVAAHNMTLNSQLQGIEIQLAGENGSPFCRKPCCQLPVEEDFRFFRPADVTMDICQRKTLPDRFANLH